MIRILIFKVFALAVIATSTAFANSTLFTLVTIYTYPEGSENYVEVQGNTQMTRQDCETQVFLLSDNKDTSLPFGRSDKWEVIGGEAKLKNGKIVVSRSQSNDTNLGFFCVPTGWNLKANS